MVKRIYREYLEGVSLLQIGRGLEADGILTGAGKTKWRPETLKKILQNEKYIGDALLQKTYTVDFLNKKRVQNKGIVPQYYVENSDFVYMLNQAQGDREILAKQLNISQQQMTYVTHSDAGEGLIFYGNVILPFIDRFPQDTELYRVMTTKPGEVSA